MKYLNKAYAQQRVYSIASLLPTLENPRGFSIE